MKVGFAGGQNMKKYVIGAVAAMLMAAVFAGAYLWTDMKLRIPNAGSNTVSQESGTTGSAAAKVDEQDIVKEIHEMSNSLIVAGDNQVWGTEEVNKANVEKVIKMLDQAPVNPKTMKLREIVVRWQQGDFSQIVDDHNYVWNLLGGTVGWAKSANEQAVVKAIAKMRQEGQ